MHDLQAQADTLQDQGEWGADALAVYEALAAADPEDEAAAVGRGRCLRALGRLSESLAVLEDFSHQHPGAFVARKQADKTRRRLRANERAATLIADDPAKLFEALEQAKREERDLAFQIEGRRLLARRERTPGAACALGAAQKRDRDLDGALITYRWAWRQDASPRSNSMAHTGLAAVLRELERLSDAEKILRGVREANPSDHFAGVGLAAVLMDRVEKQGHRDKLSEAEQLLAAAWAGGVRGAAIQATYGRLRALE